MAKKKRVIVAPDKFKGSLTAPEVTDILVDVLTSALEDSWNVIGRPLADGGEGTVRTLVSAMDGELIVATVSDPLGRPVEAEWGWLGASSGQPDTAVIEMASASGLDLLEPSERNPMKTTTFGTGELLRKAIEKGARQIILGIGGSATVDGGAGMVRALGFNLLDSEGREIPEGGRGLSKIAEIRAENVPKSLDRITLNVACDVENPLLGENGAANVYASQKGASPQQVQQLEKNLTRWADHVERFRDEMFRDHPGSGAAGGLGFGLVALLGATLEPGASLVMDCMSLESDLSRADYLITGEGQIDRQTAYGKTPYAVATRARESGIQFILGVAGRLGKGYEECYSFLDGILSLPSGPISEKESRDQVENLLRSRALDLSYWIRALEEASSAGEGSAKSHPGGE